jgi:hypothetical protein
MESRAALDVKDAARADIGTRPSARRLLRYLTPYTTTRALPSSQVPTVL